MAREVTQWLRTQDAMAEVLGANSGDTQELQRI